MRRKYLYEAIYAVLAVAVVFTALSLFTHKNDDPSYSNIVFSRYSESVGNIFGKLGAYTADYLGTVFGWCSYLIPFIILFMLVLTVNLNKRKIRFLRVLGAFFSIMLFLCSFSILSGLIGDNDPIFKDKQSGGLFGVGGAVVISSVAGKGGGIILALFAMFLSLLGTVNLSMTEFFKRVADKIRSRSKKYKDDEGYETDRKISFFKKAMSSFAAWSYERRQKRLRLRNERIAEQERKRLHEKDMKEAENEAVQNKAIESKENISSLPESEHIHIPAEPEFAEEPEPAAKVSAFDIDTGEYMTVSQLEEILNKEEALANAEKLRSASHESYDNHDEYQDGSVNYNNEIDSKSFVSEESKDNSNADDSFNDVSNKAFEGAVAENVVNEPEPYSDIIFHDENISHEAVAYAPENQTRDMPAAGNTIDEPVGGDSIKVNDYMMSVPKSDMENIVAGKDYSLSFALLEDVPSDIETQDPRELEFKADLLMQKLNDFGVDGRIREIHPGPVVTMFELELAPGIKISKVASLENDLALAMSAVSIRILAPIPGKAAVGIELPNPKRAPIVIKELLEAEAFKQSDSPLAVAFGKDIGGGAYFSDLAKMPHLLVAGTTGSGKSVCVNAIICSILYKSSPELVKFVLIDPKMVELSVYDGIPHLAAPVVTDPRKAAAVLNNVVKEMEGRYALLASCRVKSITTYNNYVSNNKGATDSNGELLKPMPYMVVIVDEFADLMMVAGKEVETAICRIAQMARAVGIHLVLATQRPSVNVITGIIKANMPARISFRVSSKIDSRTVIDQNGAEILLGKGDSLFIPPGSSEPVRIHGCFVSEEEILRVVDFLKQYGEPQYNMSLLEDKSSQGSSSDDEDMDERFDEALQIVKEKGFASISMIQRYLRIGYNRAARIVETMERKGLIAPSDGTSRPRDYIGG